MIELFPHQEKAVQELANGKVLWGGVGSGKSITSLAYYMRNEAPRDIYIITTARKRDSLDWEGEAAEFGISRDSSSVAGRLVVDSWNNIGKYEHVRDAFFIFDEQKVVGSGAWVKSFLKLCKGNRWVLLSATPGDTWLDYVPVFLANGFYKNRTEFKHEHVVYKSWTKFPVVERYVGLAKLVRLKNSILVEMPFTRHTERNVEYRPVQYDKQLFDKVVKQRWHVYENRPLRDVAELFSVMRRVVNSDSSRIQTIQMLMKEHPRLIVFYNFDYELDLLRTVLDGVKSGPTISRPTSSRKTSQPTSFEGTDTTGSPEFGMDPTPSQLQREQIAPAGPVKFGSLELAEWNGHKHQEIPDGNKWVYLVQYAAGSEAWNCIRTNVVVFFSLSYSYKMTEQAKGRIDRLNTPFQQLYYYHLVSDSLIDKLILKALGNKQDFNEGKVGISMSDSSSLV